MPCTQGAEALTKNITRPELRVSVPPSEGTRAHDGSGISSTCLTALTEWVTSVCSTSRQPNPTNSLGRPCLCGDRRDTYPLVGLFISVGETIIDLGQQLRFSTQRIHAVVRGRNEGRIGRCAVRRRGPLQITVAFLSPVAQSDEPFPP